MGILSKWVPGALLFMMAASLTALGLVMLFSAGRGGGPDAAYYARKQLVWLGAAMAAFFLALLPDYEKMRPHYGWAAAGSLLLMFLVFIPGLGVTVHGASRWIRLGPANLQAVDFARIGFLFVLAHYLAVSQRQMKSFLKGCAMPGAIIAAPFLLLLLQPDYGSACLLAAVGGCLMFLAGASLRHLVPAAAAGGLFFASAVILDPARLRRVLCFVDLEGNKSGGGYQLWQSLLSFGAGGWHGVGLGNGRQQMAFLPEPHTDFIFPVIGEELGFFFTAGVVLVFMAFFMLAFLRLNRAPSLFQFLLASGALLFIVLQALINFGVAIGLLPTKGLSLPFISYGGSNLAATYFLTGLLINCFFTWERTPVPRPFEICPHTS